MISFIVRTSSLSEEAKWFPIIFQQNSSIYFPVNHNNSYDDQIQVKTNNYEVINSKGNLTDHNWNCDQSNYTNLSIYENTINILTTMVTASILGVIILATVIGNVFVIAAILLERNLQNVANYLILSLAVADLLVACLVMPLGAVYEISQEWSMGPELCDMWTSSDVLCCTASILHLVAIALDRYWAVTNVDYIHQRTFKRIGVMILIIWLVSFFVCIAPLLGWKDTQWEDRIRSKKCLISQDLYYQLFATASSFYLPLFVILVLYWRIFQTARKRIRRRQTGTARNQTNSNPAMDGIASGLAAAGGSTIATVIGRPLPTISETTTAFTMVSSANSSPERCVSYANDHQYEHHPKVPKRHDVAYSKRERKAAKTLAIITGAFIICWLPFFIMALILPIDIGLFDNRYIVSLCLWLGYFNSTLNPMIYTVFSPEFRHAFKKLLCARKYGHYRRNRHYGIRRLQ